jgi:hypothetical protein
MFLLWDLWDGSSRMAARIWRAVYRRTPEPAIHQECFDIATPCRGDAFVFRVSVAELWTRQGEFDLLDLSIRKESTRAELEPRLRAISRRYPPEAAALVEQAMNADLTTPAGFADDPSLCCVRSVQVAPDEAVSEQLQEAERERLRADAEHVRKTQEFNRLEAMQVRWLAFLRQLDHDPLGQLAARLAGDQKLAETIKQHTSEQQRITEGLRELCDAATEAYQDKDVFDFSMTTDSALSRLLRHIGADGATSPNGAASANGTLSANGRPAGTGH